MKPIEYVLTEKGQKLKDFIRLDEVEVEIIKILKTGRKNRLQIVQALQGKFSEKTINYMTIQNTKLNFLQVEGLIERIE